MKILLVEDSEQELRQTKRLLEQSGFVVDAAHSAEEARNYARVYHYNAVLLDLHLTSSAEEMDGLHLISEIHSLSRAPVTDPSQRKASPCLILTHRRDTETALQTFGAGARDFISKPYDPPLLVARINVAIIVAEGVELEGKGLVKRGPVELDLFNAEVMAYGETLKFGRQEYRFLKYLMSTRRAVPTEELVSQLWDSAKGRDSDNVFNLVSRVRKLLVSAVKQDPILHVPTLPGYRFLDLPVEE